MQRNMATAAVMDSQHKMYIAWIEIKLLFSTQRLQLNIAELWWRYIP
jgi:hypothetical protein